MTEIDPRYEKRMSKDPKLLWLEPEEMKAAHRYKYTVTKKSLCVRMRFSDSTFKRYIHPNIEHVYDYTFKPARMLYDNDQLMGFISQNVTLEQRVKFVCIENYIENWEAYAAALDAIDEQFLAEMYAFAQNPTNVKGEPLGENTKDYREWQRYLKHVDEDSNLVRFSPTREEPSDFIAVVPKYVAASDIEKRVRQAQREHLSEAGLSLMDVEVDERKRTALTWVDITNFEDEMIQLVKVNYSTWDTVANMRNLGESDEQVYRRLFRGGARGREFQANIKITLQMPDKNGKLGKQVYYTRDPLIAMNDVHSSPHSLFSYTRTGMDAFVRSGLPLYTNPAVVDDEPDMVHSSRYDSYSEEIPEGWESFDVLDMRDDV